MSSHGWSRRALLASPASLAAFSAQAYTPAEGPEIAILHMDWQEYRRRFITDGGRVVDTGNHDISHSEGQSYAMLLAVAADDRATFERVWGWARANLARPEDALLAWRWAPRQQRTAADRNNATDGDLVAAWALLRAHHAWRDPAHLATARRMAQEVLDRCTAEWAGDTWLLPGADGFRFARRIVVNPSYYAFRAMRELSAVAPSSLWPRLRVSGLRLVEQARFGRHALPADWVEVDPRGTFRPAEGWPARFSYDAVRVPLHLAWTGHAPEALRAVHRFWAAHSPGSMPAWVDLANGVAAPHRAEVGMRAIAGLLRQRLGEGTARVERLTAASNYYEASLLLLALLALAEAEPLEEQPLPPPREHWAGQAWRRILAGLRGDGGGDSMQMAMVRGAGTGPRVAAPRWTRTTH